MEARARPRPLLSTPSSLHTQTGRLAERHLTPRPRPRPRPALPHPPYAPPLSRAPDGQRRQPHQRGAARFAAGHGPRAQPRPGGRVAAPRGGRGQQRQPRRGVRAPGRRGDDARRLALDAAARPAVRPAAGGAGRGAPAARGDARRVQVPLGRLAPREALAAAAGTAGRCHARRGPPRHTHCTHRTQPHHRTPRLARTHCRARHASAHALHPRPRPRPQPQPPSAARPPLTSRPPPGHRRS